MKNLLFLLSFIVLTGCKSVKNDEEPENLHSDYMVYEILGLALGNQVEAIPTFSIDAKENRFQGTAGCNSIFGGFIINGKKLEFPALAVTEKYCEGGNVMQLEQDFIEALNQAEQFELRRGILTFYGKGKKPVLRATKKPQQ
ncbi:MAG TPA: META domain-containing protein [Flavobacteriaceae bacterium]|nr:META domain-containing protein [Flavobacteriaceae bacterium]